MKVVIKVSKHSNAWETFKKELLWVEKKPMLHSWMYYALIFITLGFTTVPPSNSYCLINNLALHIFPHGTQSIRIKRHGLYDDPILVPVYFLIHIVFNGFLTHLYQFLHCTCGMDPSIRVYFINICWSQF